MINKCSNLVPKVENVKTWLGEKMVLWELDKKLKFDHITKWYMHKSKYVLQYVMHKIIWDFEIKTDPLIPG